jgi:serralysin
MTDSSNTTQQLIFNGLNPKTYTWTGQTGTSYKITYSYFSAFPNYYSATDNDFLSKFDFKTVAPLTGEEGVNVDRSDGFGQKLAFVLSTDAWSAVADISFENKGNDNSAGQIAVYQAKFVESGYGATNTYPFILIPPPGTPSLSIPNSLGDIAINSGGAPGVINQSELSPGQNGYQTFTHEIGHALGLDDTNNPDGSSKIDPSLPNDQLHTIMSYISPNIIYDGKQWYPSEPMLYDILAIQTMYGPNMKSHNGDDNYIFSNDPNKPTIKAIWDAGGNKDTFDGSNQSKSVFINLNPGNFSSIGTGDRNKAYIAIAYNVGQVNKTNFIENANGGKANDELIGNDADNILKGNAGNDTLRGASAKIPW